MGMDIFLETELLHYDGVLGHEENVVSAKKAETLLPTLFH